MSGLDAALSALPAAVFAQPPGADRGSTPGGAPRALPSDSTV